MFTIPPFPPKDYVLKHVPKIQRSSSQFTPVDEPRVTQTNLGIFCSPVEYAEGETPEKIEIQQLSPFILEKMAKEAKAEWIDKPGKDDFFIHGMYKKYNQKFDGLNKHKETPFNRSYRYELVCIEERRLQKLREKCEKEEALLEEAFRSVEKKEHDETHPPMKVLDCKAQPPFWWKQQCLHGLEKLMPENNQRNLSVEARKPLKPALGRWAKEPCLTAVVVDDPCRRKYDMHLVGQPFKSEACNFYYENYPPPVIKFRPKKFS